MPISRPVDPYPDLSWSGWGDPAEASKLPDGVRQLLTDALGVKPQGDSVASLAGVRIPQSRIEPRLASRLAEIVGGANAFSDPESRIRHTRGKSTPDLLRLHSGEAQDAPDLVLLPLGHEQILAILRICSDARVAVVPFGGGTSVVGGLEPRSEAFAATIALDLRRMDALIELDEVSRLAVLEPGLRGPQAEELLGAHGYTIGHFPQSFEYATLGGFAAARSSGQASAGYGRFDELVLALRVATPAGTITLGRAPKSAAGPDLRQLILGSEGALGVITSITVQIRPLPELREYDGWRFGSFAHGTTVVRRLAQDGPVPTIVRLSDEAETALNLAHPTELGLGAERGALAIIGYEGTAEDVSARRTKATELLERSGAQRDPQAGESWSRERYRGPYLRDALLAAGALVETLETVTFWSHLGDLYSAVSNAVRQALTAQGTPPIILCHISHVYPAGASLYFTVGCAQLEDPVAQWRAAKAAAGDAILAVGGSITHHHGVGRDHRDWYVREIGELGVGVLQAVKAQLDPAGVLNPGILIPPGGRELDQGRVAQA